MLRIHCPTMSAAWSILFATRSLSDTAKPVYAATDTIGVAMTQDCDVMGKTPLFRHSAKIASQGLIMNLFFCTPKCQPQPVARLTRVGSKGANSTRSSVNLSMRTNRETAHSSE